MPLYEYACASCKRKTEVLQSFNEKPVKICPHCGGKLKKLMSSPAIQFKGSGWYVTDYAGKGSKEGSAGKGADKSSEPADSKGKESKPEPKTADKSSKKESSKKD
jgi:putative FmdB family regulatory protein